MLIKLEDAIQIAKTDTVHKFDTEVITLTLSIEQCDALETITRALKDGCSIISPLSDNMTLVSADILYNNIKNLVHKKKIKMETLESDCDLSIGYISRLYKANNFESMSLGSWIKISNMLGITLQDLLFSEVL